MNLTEEEKKKRSFRRKQWNRSKGTPVFQELFKNDFDKMILIVRHERKTKSDYHQAFEVLGNDLLKQLQAENLSDGDKLRIWFVFRSLRSRKKNTYYSNAYLMEYEVVEKKEKENLDAYTRDQHLGNADKMRKYRSEDFD